ncbi:hypothetical protein [Arthrobacter bambusae]|uniref:hypothetical protein n=1 Tax=Arthrobacter bambusae TaxID=1338426 RepID=UPI00278019A8|nr:hypothetical protein [Arthrobacter bambusae]MDQ0031487.1 hypothetical protein [Arthrobacter bambusae]MDQ0099625.1 hypothetical protein [Arthrobacter bambusae]
MRVIRHAKAVSTVAGATLVLEGCAWLWLATTAPPGPGNVRIVLLSFGAAVGAMIWGVVMLTWRLWPKPMVLVRAQAADVFPLILPIAVLVSGFLSVPEIADPARPYLWMGGLLLGSGAISVASPEKAALSEVPPLRPGRFLDWLRWQNFGAGTLWLSILFTATFFFDLRRSGAFAPLIIVLALAQATVSVWFIIEHRQFSKVGVRLSGLQINWLRVIHVSRGHEAAVKELRTMYPKMGPALADAIIENLYQTQENPGSL